jgi:hypothetical protein
MRSRKRRKKNVKESQPKAGKVESTKIRVDSAPSRRKSRTVVSGRDPLLEKRLGGDSVHRNAACSSKTVKRTLLKGEYVKVFSHNFKPKQIWRRDNPGLSYRRNGRRINPSDALSPVAWICGIIRIQTKSGHIPKEIAKLFLKVGFKTFTMRTNVSVTEARKIISFLHSDESKVLNIFGSFSDACRIGDPALKALIAVLSSEVDRANVISRDSPERVESLYQAIDQVTSKTFSSRSFGIQKPVLHVKSSLRAP